jgi:D-arabinose 1-dehydrogenase-like Zn-dependent alcohol dehydrogenase
MGCEVVVFSGTNSKEEEARQLGAREFVVMKGVESLAIKPINHLMVTTSAQPNWGL